MEPKIIPSAIQELSCGCVFHIHTPCKEHMKNHAEWRYDKPPNETLVEAELNGGIIRVRAIWGRDGTLPHWESEDRSTVWSVQRFGRWRFPR
jgi:hypothetical protein